MNPYGDTDQNSHPCDDDDAASLPCSDLGLDSDTHNPSFSSSPCPPVILTGHTSSPSSHHLAPTITTPTSSHISVIIPSPDLQQSPLPPQFLEDTSPDLECAICFSEFNNVFRCPKMLHCKHTFCLECLARINVKSAEPSNIQCPLCRGLTPLPILGLPRLPTDSDVLSYLPAAMQRVYSIRFLRKKGKLEVKRSSGSHQHWGQRMQTSANPSLHVGLPSPPVEGPSGAGGMGGALFRLTGQPACRAVLLTSVVMMMLLLTGIVIFLLTFKMDSDPE